MNYNPWKPLIYFSLVALGLGLGILLKPAGGISASGANTIENIIELARSSYVDTVNDKQMRAAAIEGMLSQLDPHSVYISPEDLAAANEPLEGGFDGIGVEFSIMNDTVMVVSPIHGGPSEQLGIQSGDRIVMVEGKNIAGIKITNEQVMKLLKGEQGTKVKIGIFRKSSGKTLTFNITRDKIPIHSVDVGYMLNKETGYIKISRFAQNTHEEFLAKLKDLKKSGLKNLVIDLRNNPGGYLSAATSMADELIDGDKLIVYTQGTHQKKAVFEASKDGAFEHGKLVLLVDEGSASASEILSGAVQDWDRGLIIGRRSFGKGLVQEPMPLADGGEIRLTVARYYTPTGRCIQKPFEENHEAYQREIIARAQNGEMEVADSGKFAKNKKFKTPAGRTVYAGGGIMPDIFVPADTTHNSIYFYDLIQEDIIRQYSFDSYEQKQKLYKSFKTVEELYTHIISDQVRILADIARLGREKGVEDSNRELQKSAPLIMRQHASLIARQVFGETGFYTVMNMEDKTIKASLTQLDKYPENITK
jgi:carboxyl-terminal processing protease